MIKYKFNKRYGAFTSKAVMDASTKLWIPKSWIPEWEEGTPAQTLTAYVPRWYYDKHNLKHYNLCQD